MTDEIVLTFPGWCDDPEPRHVPRSECVLATVPALFYNDHVYRDLTAGVIERDGSRTVTVWLDQVCVDDLRGDAELYDSFRDDDRRDNRSLCASARRTLQALARATSVD
jgi:hypothetical protein